MSQKKITFLLIIVAGLLFVAFNTFFIVRQTEQALVLRFGKPVTVEREAGLKVKTPFVEHVDYFEKRLLEFDADTKEFTASDQKRLKVDAFVRYHIVDPLKFRQTVQTEQGLRDRLDGILEKSLRTVIGSISLSAIISEKRSDLMRRVKNVVNLAVSGAELDDDGNVVKRNATQGFGIEVIDVRIKRADLPEENSEAIYRRMQTEREREAKEIRAKGAEEAQKITAEAERDRTILLAEAQKKSEILRGEGEKESTRIYAEAFSRDKAFFELYRTLQAYRTSLNKDDTTLILSPDSTFLKVLQTGKP